MGKESKPQRYQRIYRDFTCFVLSVWRQPAIRRPRKMQKRKPYYESLYI